MSATDDLLRQNEWFARTFPTYGKGSLHGQPARKVAVVACMDARIDVFRSLGLKEGDAHVIRNAGGIVTDDVIRSLVISQRLLGTEEVVLIHHTDCGMQKFDDKALREQIEQETGVEMPFAMGAFPDVEQDVRRSIATVRESPFLPHRNVRGFVYDVKTGRLAEIA
jgi:carbonic anhydrase